MSESSPEFPVLLHRNVLAAKVKDLAAAIAADHATLPVLVCVIEGARRFANDLQFQLPDTAGFHEIRASSYGEGTVSRGSVHVVGGDDIHVDGREVLLLEDIVDTGRTVKALQEFFFARGACSVDVATLLTKPSRRAVAVDLRYVGFEIEDHFVIGYGMDVAGRYRELEDVVLYDEALERA